MNVTRHSNITNRQNLVSLAAKLVSICYHPKTYTSAAVRINVYIRFDRKQPSGRVDKRAIGQISQDGLVFVQLTAIYAQRAE